MTRPTLYVDVETGRGSMAVLAHLAHKHRDFEGAALAKKVDDAYDKTSLSPVLGELWVIGYAIDDHEPSALVRQSATPEGERDLCAAWLDLAASMAVTPLVVAHSASFDRAFLRVRARRHGLPVPAWLAGDGKPWESAWLCTMDALRTDYRDRVSLDDAVIGLACDVPTKGEMHGSQVWGAICDGRIDDVVAYCLDDVRRVRAVAKVLGLT
jgi:hypothetical protein